MAVDNFIYQGINRAYSDYAGTRTCEELINLRPTSEGTVPVKDFSVKMADVPWSRIYVHHTTSGPKYIVLGKGSGTVYAKWVELVGGVWTDRKTFFSLSSLTGIEDDVLNNVSYASAGNIILFSLCDQTHSKYGNWAFTWKMNDSGNMTYVDTEADAPAISYSITSGTLEYAHAVIPIIDAKASSGEVTSVVESAINEMLDAETSLCIGPTIIAVAFKTKDGSTFWTGNWRIYDPRSIINTQSYEVIDDTNQYYVEWIGQDFFTKYGYGYNFYGEDQNDVAHATMNGVKVSLTFARLASGSWDAETSLIQSVEVYCSRPRPYLDAQNAYEGWSGTHKVMLVPPAMNADMELDSQLLYHQASIELSALAESAQTVSLTFGGNLQVTEDTLDTDAGALVRYGRILSYNARFHYWDSVSHTDIGIPSFNLPGFQDSGRARANIFVNYSDDKHTGIIWVGSIQSFEYGYPAYFVIAPSLNIKEVITYTKGVDNKYYTRKYRMTQSTSYNYTVCCNSSYYNDEANSSPNAELEALIPSGGTAEGITTLEPDAINVTEQYNPFVFRVEHSYKAPGNVLDVQPQMAGIVDASYGRDPLNVFTERGLYALTQGSANVLYGAFLPLNQLVISKGSGSTPTEMGIFFLADGALWLVSGRRCTLISDALHLGPHKYIRACEGYQRISGVDEVYTPSSTVSSSEYDVSDYLSQVTFEDFVKGVNGGSTARVSFNRFRMELFVSNPAYPYTYVLSLKYRQWFKLSRQVWQDENGSDLANTPGPTAGHLNVLDLSTEVTGPVLVHMQSRPFSMGYQYCHIRRIVAMARTHLDSSSRLAVVAIYGSENLQDWSLLAYAKRAGDTVTVNGVTTDTPLKVSQIRTTPSARSWRYYTVCIGGSVPDDTDLGPILVDYEPVIRRIG